MVEIIMIGVLCVLLINLVLVMTVLGRRTSGHSWLLALLLTGTTGAALAAILAGLIPDASNRFVDLSLVLMGLAALPVVTRVLLLRRETETIKGADRHDQ